MIGYIVIVNIKYGCIFYVTNDLHNSDVETLIEQFSFSDERVKAFIGVKYYKLSDIKNIYYGDRFTNRISFTAKLTTSITRFK